MHPSSKLPKYVFRDTTKSGVVRYRVRPPGQPKTRLPGEPGSPEFEAAYEEALKKSRSRSAPRGPFRDR